MNHASHLEADLVIDIQGDPTEEVEEVDVVDFHAIVHEVAIIHVEADLVIDIQGNPKEEVEEVNVVDFHVIVHEVAIIHVEDHE